MARVISNKFSKEKEIICDKCNNIIAYTENDRIKHLEDAGEGFKWNDHDYIECPSKKCKNQILIVEYLPFG